MARRYTWLVIVALIVLGVVITVWVLGLGGGSLPTGQDSPQATLRKLQQAMAKGDKAKFVECFAARSANYKAAIEALFECVQAAQALRNALRSHYGKDAWDTFADRLAEPPEVRAFTWPPDEDFAATKVALKGAEASVGLPSGIDSLSLKLSGVWRVELYPHGSGVRERRDALARAAEALRKAKDDIGKPGVTPETLAKQVGDLVKAGR